MFKHWNLLLFLFLCCFAARASTVTLTCVGNSTTLTGSNISSSCSVSPGHSAEAVLSTSTSETTASVSADEGAQALGMLRATASFTVDETWLILGGTGSAELGFNNPNSNGLPPFLTMSAEPLGDPFGDAVVSVSSLSGLNISYGNVTGSEAAPIDFTFGVPFSFVATVNLFADNDFGDGGRASVEYVTGAQTYTIPNANTVSACSICPNSHSPWEIIEPNFEGGSATLIRTASDTSLPEPPFAGPLLVLLLAFALWQYRPAMRSRFAAVHSLSARVKS